MQSSKKLHRPKLLVHFARPALHSALVLAVTLTIAATSSTVYAQSASSTSSSFDDTAARRFYASAGFGFDFSRGDYGDSTKTNSLAVPVFLKLEWEPITFRISVPYTVINGSENVVGDTGGTSAGVENFLGTSIRHGIGDVVTSLTYTYYPNVEGLPVVDLVTKVKIPTATSDLGTGETDVTLQLELSKSLGDLSVFAGAGYRLNGGAPYDNTVLASVGIGYLLTRSFSIGLAYDYREASVSRSEDSHEISPYLSIRAGKHLRFGPYGLVGLSESAPDWGLGANVSWNF